jgi:hypothetical protein
MCEVGVKFRCFSVEKTWALDDQTLHPAVMLPEIGAALLVNGTLDSFVSKLHRSCMGIA